MTRTYVGLDLHTTQITTHRIVINEAGAVERKSGRYSMDKLESVFLGTLGPGSAVCLEAGSGSHALARMIVAKGARAFIVDPSKLQQLFMTNKKTDQVDAKKLADALRAHLEHEDPHDGFPEVYIADEESQRLRMLVSQYDLLGREKTALINNIYAVFRQWLVSVDKGTVIDELETYLAHPRVPPEAALIVRQEARRYQTLVSDREEVRRCIEQLGVLRFPEQVSLLIGMPGISVFGAAVIMADIITIDRFKTHKQLASYLRAAPRVDASNTTVRIGRLNKAGRHMSFQILLQGVGHLGEGNPFIKGYIRRSTGKPRNKLRATTVARSITQIFYILKKREANRFIQPENYLKKMRQVEKIKELCKAA